MIKVSVAMITYKHENYIRQAIEGVLMQQCNFEVELIIADDKSPDNTERVVEEVIKSHPKKQWVKYTKHEVNKGIVPNAIWAKQQALGEYVALCEGDDYWTDPLKLQKQVDFLDSNPKYSMVCHNAIRKYEGLSKRASLFSPRRNNQDLAMKTIINQWAIPTASMVFRRQYVDMLPNWFKEIYSGDYSLALMLGHWGKIYYFKEIMSVYRLDNAGNNATVNFGNNYEFIRDQHLKLMYFFNRETKGKYTPLIEMKKEVIKEHCKFRIAKQKNLIKAFILHPKMFISTLLNKIKMTFLSRIAI